MNLVQRILHVGGFALFSAIVFLLLESVLEYIWANWISSKPPWPDQKSITGLIESGTFETIVYLVALLVGISLSLSQFNRLKVAQKFILSIILAVTCGALYTVLGLTKLPQDPRISFGVVLLWPVFVIVISSVGVRYLARRVFWH